MPNIAQQDKNVNSQDMTPDDAAASLAFATNLSSQFMPKAPIEEQEPQNGTETAPGQEIVEEPVKDATQDIEAVKTQFQGEIDKLREEIKANSKDTLENIKKELKEALADE